MNTILQKLKLKIRPPKISIIVLNWNRQYLLRSTVYSILATTRLPYELIIVDNNSSDGSKEWIKLFSKNHKSVKIILLKENIGGEAINLAFKECTGKFIYISENDIEYLPNWDKNLVLPFYLFNDLGQLSPFAPSPQRDIGEIWIDKPYIEERKYDNTKIYLTRGNIGSSQMLRKKIIDQGVKWYNREDNSSDSGFKFPDDGKFSTDIIAKGYKVAWSGKYRAINWGHNVNTWKLDLKYFNENYASKSTLKLEGVEKRLNAEGYKLIKDTTGNPVDIVKC